MNDLKNPWPSYRLEYPSELGDVQPGRPFFMLNYEGLFMRVNGASLKLVEADGCWVRTWDFNDRGEHYPIVNLTTGALFHMHKTKPVRVY